MPTADHDISLALTINDLVTLYPEALPVLRSFGLDTCCGGAHALGFAAERHGHDPQEVLAAVRDAVAGVRR